MKNTQSLLSTSRGALSWGNAHDGPIILQENLQMVFRPNLYARDTGLPQLYTQYSVPGFIPRTYPDLILNKNATGKARVRVCLLKQFSRVHIVQMKFVLFALRTFRPVLVESEKWVANLTPDFFSGPSVLIKKSYLNNNIEPTPTLCCKVA